MNISFVLVLLFGVFQLSFGENLNCQFKDDTYYFGNFYSCKVTSLDNTNNNMVINGHNGNHKSNRIDMDVKAIWMYDTNMKFIPENLGHLFNLVVLCMSNTQLVEINAKSFQKMEELIELSLYNNKLTSVPSNAFTKLINLKSISLSSNQIEELPNGLFTNNLNLEEINLFRNKIKYLGSTLFDRLTKLIFVNVWDNVCIDKLYQEKTGIIQLKNDIKIECFNPNN